MQGGVRNLEVLVPETTPSGNVSARAALDLFLKGGLHLGMFDTPSHANAYAERLHNWFVQNKRWFVPLALPAIALAWRGRGQASPGSPPATRALGVVGQARGLNLASIDTYDVESMAPKFNIAEQLAREIMWVNDEHVSPHRWVEFEICGPVRPYYPDWGKHTQTVSVPNEHAGFQRWQQVREWVAKQIKD